MCPVLTEAGCGQGCPPYVFPAKLVGFRRSTLAGYLAPDTCFGACRQRAERQTSPDVMAGRSANSADHEHQQCRTRTVSSARAPLLRLCVEHSRIEIGQSPGTAIARPTHEYPFVGLRPYLCNHQACALWKTKKNTASVKAAKTRMSEASIAAAETTPFRKPVTLTIQPAANRIVSRIIPTSASSAAFLRVMVGVWTLPVRSASV